MLRIRPYRKNDGKRIIKWIPDERTAELWRADRFEWPLTDEQFECYYNAFSQDEDKAAFTVTDKEGKPVGHFSVRDIDWEKNRGHMGFIILDPGMRGNGLGREMIRLALDYIFRILKLSAVTLGVYDCNAAARHCYEAEGFALCSRPGFTRDFHGERWSYFYLEARNPLYPRDL